MVRATENIATEQGDRTASELRSPNSPPPTTAINPASPAHRPSPQVEVEQEQGDSGQVFILGCSSLEQLRLAYGEAGDQSAIVSGCGVRVCFSSDAA